MTLSGEEGRRIGKAGGNDGLDVAARLFGWVNLAMLAVFLAEIWLIYGAPEMPGPAQALAGGGAAAWVMLLAWPAAALAAAFWVVRTPLRGLREDCDDIAAFNAFLIRGCFFAVLYVGIADAAISFLRVEGLLEQVVGADLASDLGRSHFRGPNVHLPLVALGFATAFFSRTLGFTWLALLIVAAELLIVITRFIFSYEQAFMGDLVRFWYAALFLFASAHTLMEEGHVRVDVFYAGFRPRTKGMVNAVGTVLLGMVLCWTVLIIGFAGRSAIITGALSNYEVSQSGFGMYVKYLMAGYLGVFAITMLIQFTAYFFDAVADWRGEPGGRAHDGAHAA
ncbi:TRAP transporter small permease subunit [Oceanicella actignis]|uniref:TRAP transporter small permease protein n=1 Tax=Oceanicella actignis TaxID=1189325 RepID=A0A1M7T1C6_9RHOB|nr:TRAP transporter small permease subunit [Oceanicella actignis]TYO88918.1 tripartite ATP-independent transporter DctQ subunit [Oceanicella actignis]SET37336.1 Tripartite ATP-independent transporter, DctQ component [Oceanicella actignis]SHN64441.1 Tripartite ATP-independent transporter, DctQ component [Oceanicella actignis]